MHQGEVFEIELILLDRIVYFYFIFILLIFR